MTHITMHSRCVPGAPGSPFLQVPCRMHTPSHCLAACMYTFSSRSMLSRSCSCVRLGSTFTATRSARLAPLPASSKPA